MRWNAAVLGLVLLTFGARAATPVIDILVVYTTAAKNGAGGADKLAASVAKQITATNIIFTNSGINAKVRLVDIEETTSFQESGNILTDLSTLTNASYFPGFGIVSNGPNPQSDPIHALRDQVGADIVVLVTENANFGNNQIAAGFSNISVQNAVPIPEYAYSVVVRSNITIGGYAFTHELGHVFGCRHDATIEFANSAGAYPYSYGWHWMVNSTLYCDIMGQVSGSTAVLQFSNPNLSYKGVPTGVADHADNARTINNTAPMVAAYRGSTTPVPVDSTTDTDGDGFPDELETYLQTSPTDPSSTPFGGSPAMAQPLTVSKFGFKFKLTAENSDSLALAGTLPIPANFVVAGQKVVFDIGGVLQTFTLDAHGNALSGNDKFAIKIKSSKGSVAAQTAKFGVAFVKDSLSAKFSDENMDGSANAKSEARSVQIIVLFNATMYKALRPVTYSAAAGKSAGGK